MFSSVLAALAVLVLAVQLARAEAADAPPHEHKLKRLKNLVDECAFTVAGTSFDLCPVVNGNEGGWTVKTERRTPPTVTATEYRIDLKAPLKKDGEVPGHEQVSPWRFARIWFWFLADVRPCVTARCRLFHSISSFFAPRNRRRSTEMEGNRGACRACHASMYSTYVVPKTLVFPSSVGRLR